MSKLNALTDVKKAKLFLESLNEDQIHDLSDETGIGLKALQNLRSNSCKKTQLRWKSIHELAACYDAQTDPNCLFDDVVSYLSGKNTKKLAKLRQNSNFFTVNPNIEWHSKDGNVILNDDDYKRAMIKNAIRDYFENKANYKTRKMLISDVVKAFFEADEDYNQVKVQ